MKINDTYITEWEDFFDSLLVKILATPYLQYGRKKRLKKIELLFHT
jgi:hypothetical protein